MANHAASPAIAICCLIALASPASSQAPRAGASTDPYTRGEAAAMEKAGYVSFGPFAWADDHDTRDVEEILGRIPLLWVETAHFKIGSSLSACAIVRGAQSRKVRAELATLRKTLPRVRARVAVLDSWLRLHLLAQRLEATYRDLTERLGVADDDFPSAESAEIDMGSGAYLGMRDKFTVLLLERESSFARYLARFAGIERQRYPLRHHFASSGSLFFGTTAEFSEGALRDDTRTHCQVVFNVVHNLLDGYRGFRHRLPPWWKSGVAQWYLRRIDPRFHQFDQMVEGGAELRKTSHWEPWVRAMVVHDGVAPAETLLRYPDYSGWKFDDYVLAWSRVDYLMSRGNEGFAAFMNVMKDPFSGTPTADRLWARQRAALEEAWELEPKSFDTSWRAWVRGHYAKR